MLNFLTVLQSNYDVKEESNNSQPKESKKFTSEEANLIKIDADDKYDVIALETGFKECLLTGLPSIACKKSEQRFCPVSIFIETSNPKEEIKPGLDILGSIANKAVSICDFYEPCIPGSQDDIYCTSSYDPTPHFKSTIEEVLKLYKEIMDEPFKS
ncbi:Rab GDP dissociation inhibitor alpha [Tritrichomonas musculus]|uniref:Rab GDP dissociation inhibitor alpha n=1 Tax=Tritrichomonas musculus TaxID=1915356 RepID=A0ABR2JDU1_9EUKA